MGQGAKAKLVQPSRFGEGQAAAIEQVVEEVLNDLVEGTRGDRLRNAPIGHPRPKVRVNQGHARDPSERLAVRRRREFAEVVETCLDHLSGGDGGGSGSGDGSQDAENRFRLATHEGWRDAE